MQCFSIELTWQEIEAALFGRDPEAFANHKSAAGAQNKLVRPTLCAALLSFLWLT
eukprot:COSAG04_NODE_1051_length_8554_cov_151.236310_9_plen_55_part_00